MGLLIDCDVLLDALERQPFVDASAKLLDFLEESPQFGAIAWHWVNNLYYITAKLGNKDNARQLIAD